MFKWMKKITGSRWSLLFLNEKEQAYALHEESIIRLIKIIEACYAQGDEVSPWSIHLSQNIQNRQFRITGECFGDGPQRRALVEFIHSTPLSSISLEDGPITSETVFVDVRSGNKIPMRSASRTQEGPKRLEELMITNPKNATQLFQEQNQDDFLDIMSKVFAKPEWRLRYDPSANLPNLPWR